MDLVGDILNGGEMAFNSCSWFPTVGAWTDGYLWIHPNYKNLDEFSNILTNCS